MKQQIIAFLLIFSSLYTFSQNGNVDGEVRNDSVQKFSTVQESTQDISKKNKANQELKKFKKFKGKLDQKNLNQKIYLNQIRSYSKDSLQILEVKLLSILELENMLLLEIDISKNTSYYISILEALKSSSIHPSEYRFLESKLTLSILKKAKEKYSISVFINILLIGIVLCLFFYIYKGKRKKKMPHLVSLSKQEENIKNHILEGKTNKEIADKLFISLSTVKTHITSIYKKLNVSNRAELLLKLKNSTGTST